MTSVEQTLADLSEAVKTFSKKSFFVSKLLNGFKQRKTIVYTFIKPYLLVNEI